MKDERPINARRSTRGLKTAVFASNLDRRVQFQRYTDNDNGFETVKVWANHGEPVWASKTPLSDRERWSADQHQASTMARFVVRYSSFTAGLTPADRLVCEGITHEIEGLKELGRRAGFEITTIAAVHQ